MYVIITITTKAIIIIQYNKKEKNNNDIVLSSKSNILVHCKFTKKKSLGLWSKPPIDVWSHGKCPPKTIKKIKRRTKRTENKKKKNKWLPGILLNKQN